MMAPLRGGSLHRFLALVSESSELIYVMYEDWNPAVTELHARKAKDGDYIQDKEFPNLVLMGYCLESELVNPFHS